MTYRFELNGVQVECDSFEELIQIAKGRAVVRAVVKRRRRGSGAGIRKSWVAARRLAKKEGISVAEARSKLKKAKK